MLNITIGFFSSFFMEGKSSSVLPAGINQEISPLRSRVTYGYVSHKI